MPPLAVTALDPPDPDSDTRRSAAFFGVLLLYFQLIGYGVWVALGVVEEKSSRVVELLLATLRPWQLLTGKVVGIGLLGLGQLVLTGLVGIAAALGTGAIDVPSGIAGVAGQVIIWFLLGFAFYACLYAALAALVSRQEEVQNVTAPLSILLVGSFFLAITALNSPDGGLAKVTSIVPPFSTMVMPIRWAAGDVPAVGGRRRHPAHGRRRGGPDPGGRAHLRRSGAAQRAAGEDQGCAGGGPAGRARRGGSLIAQLTRPRSSTRRNESAKRSTSGLSANHLVPCQRLRPVRRMSTIGSG